MLTVTTYCGNAMTDNNIETLGKRKARYGDVMYEMDVSW
jgi:hypothetical protein